MKYRCSPRESDTLSRSSHEERGLKSHVNTYCAKVLRRSSHEERGLKSKSLITDDNTITSLLSRGAWIEIIRSEITNLSHDLSLLSRGAWIEIHLRGVPFSSQRVAPLTRSVD